MLLTLLNKPTRPSTPFYRRPQQYLATWYPATAAAAATPTAPSSALLQGLVLIGPALHYWYGSLGSLVKAGGNTGAALRMVVDQLCFAPLFISGKAVGGAVLGVSCLGGACLDVACSDAVCWAGPAGCGVLLSTFCNRTFTTSDPPPAAAIVSSIMTLEGKGPEVPGRLRRYGGTAASSWAAGSSSGCLGAHTWLAFSLSRQACGGLIFFIFFALRLRRDLLDIMKSNWLLWVPFQFVNFRFVPPQLQVGRRGWSGAL